MLIKQAASSFALSTEVASRNRQKIMKLEKVGLWMSMSGIAMGHQQQPEHHKMMALVMLGTTCRLTRIDDI